MSCGRMREHLQNSSSIEMCTTVTFLRTSWVCRSIFWPCTCCSEGYKRRKADLQPTTFMPYTAVPVRHIHGSSEHLIKGSMELGDSMHDLVCLLGEQQVPSSRLCSRNVCCAFSCHNPYARHWAPQQLYKCTACTCSPQISTTLLVTSGYTIATSHRRLHKNRKNYLEQ